jgi:hypothetical protein
VAQVRVTMNHGNIFTFLHDPSGPVHREVSSKVRKVDAIGTATAPVKEGRLRNARNSGVRDEGTRLVGYVEFTVDYAIYHAKGTGIYGPRGRKITPKKAKALVFRVNGELVFAKSVRGIKPNPWLVKALETGAAPWPVTVH